MVSNQAKVFIKEVLKVPKEISKFGANHLTVLIFTYKVFEPIEDDIKLSPIY